MCHGAGHMGQVQTRLRNCLAGGGQDVIDCGGAVCADIRATPCGFGKDAAIGGGNSDAASGAAAIDADQKGRINLCHLIGVGHLFWRGKTIFTLRFASGGNGFANGTPV